MKFVLTLLGIVLTLLGGGLCVVANLNFGSVMTLLLGLFFLVIGLFWQRVQESTKSGVAFGWRSGFFKGGY